MTVVRRRVTTSPKDSAKDTSRHKVMLFNGEATVSNVSGKWTRCWVQICKKAKAMILRTNSMPTITIESHLLTKPTTDQAAFTGRTSSCISSRAWDHINSLRPTASCRAGTIRPCLQKASFPSIPAFTSSSMPFSRATSWDPHQRIPACETWYICRAGICQQFIRSDLKIKFNPLIGL